MISVGKEINGKWKGATAKVQKSGKAEVLYNGLTLTVPSFLQHIFTKQMQSDSYMTLKEQVEKNDSTAVLQIDFAEMYSTFWQDKVQSAYWHKNQITVFTAALWQSVGCTSAVVVSDDCSHSRDCVNVS